MDKQTKKGLGIFLFVIGVLLIGGFINVWYEQTHKFRYEDHLSDIIMKVDDREVSVQELGYYIYTVEQFVDQQARLYNPEDPGQYWNTHFSAGLQSKFISDMAEDTVYSTCICDFIYESMALEEGYSLSAEEIKDAGQKAEEMFQKLTEQQRQKTGLTPEIIQKTEERKLLVSKYADDYIDTVDFTGYSGRPEELISAGGDYYEAEILPGHTIWYNTKLKEKIEIGKITLLLSNS